MQTVKYKVVVTILPMMFFFMAFTPSHAKEKSLTPDEIQKRWKEYADPGKPHDHLKYFVGKWKGQAKMWMSPDSQPQKSVYEVQSRLILGGRYLESYLKGTYEGELFEGRQITGFDNQKKKYISQWIDNMGTGFYPTSGTLDAEGRQRSESGVWTCPITQGDLSVRMLTRVIDKNSYIMEMYTRGGMYGPKEFKSMEVLYTRK